MYVAKDKFGTVLISVKEPERMTAHWKAPDCQYMIMNARYAETMFPDLRWEDEPIQTILNIS